jgi:hypothetical protein
MTFQEWQQVSAPSGDVKDWSVEDVAQWLKSKGVEILAIFSWVCFSFEGPESCIP